MPAVKLDLTDEEHSARKAADIMREAQGSPATWLFLLNLASALAAFAAAVLWWLSSSPLPPMNSYFGGVPPDDPFFVALQDSARLSGYAARCAGVSALLFGVATLLGRAKTFRWLRFARSRESRRSF